MYMKIAVMGSGGVGGYFGARLAKGGADVAFVARGSHLAAMREHGEDRHTRHPVMAPDMIRQLPAGFALVIRGGNAPVIARLPRAWRNRAYRRARRLHLEPPIELPHHARWAEPVIPGHIPAGMVPGNSHGSCFPWN